MGKPLVAWSAFLATINCVKLKKKIWIVHYFHGSYLKGSKQGSGKLTVMKCSFCHALN